MFNDKWDRKYGTVGNEWDKKYRTVESLRESPLGFSRPDLDSGRMPKIGTDQRGLVGSSDSLELQRKMHSYRRQEAAGRPTAGKGHLHCMPRPLACADWEAKQF